MQTVFRGPCVARPYACVRGRRRRRRARRPTNATRDASADASRGGARTVRRARALGAPAATVRGAGLAARRQPPVVRIESAPASRRRAPSQRRSSFAFFANVVSITCPDVTLAWMNRPSPR
jgi:hypothetical protein